MSDFSIVANKKIREPGLLQSKIKELTCVNGCFYWSVMQLSEFSYYHFSKYSQVSYYSFQI